MKPKIVAFISKKLRDSYEDLAKRKFEDRRLHKYISRALRDLREDSESGIKIPKKLWSKEYVRNFKITNLYKYDLPNGWRMIYTIKENELKIISIILEWFPHKDYEKKFKY